MTSRIRSSWFMVDEPGKMGFPVNSSPRMQPAMRQGTLISMECGVTALSWHQQ